MLPLPLENLVILLPPRQKEGTTTSNATAAVSLPGILHLPPLQLEELVQSIRMALSEVIGYAHFTNYRLEIEDKQQQQPPVAASVAAASVVPPAAAASA
jgi:hypothetical protein